MRRGDLYLVDLGPGTGREPVGIRPVIVVSNDGLNSLPMMIAVVPGIDLSVPRVNQSSVVIPAAESGLPADAAFAAYLVRALDPRRFPAAPVGRVSAGRLAQLDAALRIVLDLP